MSLALYLHIAPAQAQAQAQAPFEAAVRDWAWLRAAALSESSADMLLRNTPLLTSRAFNSLSSSFALSNCCVREKIENAHQHRHHTERGGNREKKESRQQVEAQDSRQDKGGKTRAAQAPHSAQPASMIVIERNSLPA